MANPSTVVWNVKTTGSDLNGGGFDTASTGTDYSTQDAPILALTDLASAGNATAVVTSATAGFTAAMVGNVLRLAAGTGYNAGGYTIASYQSATQVTLDRTPASTASAASGGTCKVGGAVATPGVIGADITALNRVNLNPGTYTATNGTNNISGGSLRPTQQCRVVGVGSVTIQTSGTTISPIVPGNNNCRFENLTFQDNGAAMSLFYIGNFQNTVLENCTFITNTVNSTGITAISSVRVDKCRFSGVGKGITHTSGYLDVLSSVFSGGTGGGQAINTTATNNMVLLSECIFYNVPSAAAIGLANNAATIRRCTFHNSTGAAIQITTAGSANNVSIEDCVFTNNGTYGVDSTVAAPLAGAFVKNCAFYQNSSGPVNSPNIPAANVTGSITLSGNPYVDSANGNFGLNNVAGAGAALRGVSGGAFFGLATTTAYADVGAVQHADSGGGSALPPIVRGVGVQYFG